MSAQDDFARANGLSPGNPYLAMLYGSFSQGPAMPNSPNAAMFNAQLSAAQKWEDDQKAQQNQADLNSMSVDPRLQDLSDQETKLATDFRNNIPQVASTFGQQIAEVNKRNLADELSRNTEDYNARGLLYSTARQGANAASQQKAASTQAGEVAQENEKLGQTADQLDSAALGTKEALAGEKAGIGTEQAGIQQDYLNIALNNQAQQQQLVGQAWGSLGALGGYGGGQSQKSNGLLNNSSGTGSAGPGPGFPSINPTVDNGMNYGGYA